MRYVALVALSLAFTPIHAKAQPAANAQEQYVLGPLDRLVVRVHSLRKSVGEAYPWDPLNGEFSVGADGYISMPLVGQIKAAGATTLALAEKISKSLQDAANLAERPSASVEVLMHRPFFILGAVQKPGKYEFQPGMTVLQALSIAQGLARADDLTLVERDMIASAGDLRSLEAERVALEAKLARLTAEISGKQAIEFPETLATRENDPRVATATRQERLTFEARRAALAAEVEALERSKALLEQELVSLANKSKSLDQLAEINTRELRTVKDLLARGLTVTPRQVAAQTAQATIESNILDVQIARLRAQQSLSQANRDIVDIRARYRKETLAEAATTRLLLAQNAEKARTAEELVQNAERRSPASQADAGELEPIYRLTRLATTGPRTWSASADTVLEAGDVLNVLLPRRQSSAPHRSSDARRIN